MIQPLTKRRGTGGVYSRPPAIEAAIERALRLDHGVLLACLAIPDPKESDFIPPECLVHLVRKAHREGAALLRDRLLSKLFERAEKILSTTLPDGRLPNAEALRDEVLAQLGAKLARDGKGKNPDALDFFEIHFNSAFAALRIDVVRPVLRNARRAVPLPEATDGDDAAGPTAEARRVTELLSVPAQQDGDLLVRRLHVAIDSLPLQLRDAATLAYIEERPIESKDPTVLTVSRALGITPRAVRLRLEAAAELLSRFKEEK